jgi:hypothetical protein
MRFLFFPDQGVAGGTTVFWSYTSRHSPFCLANTRLNSATRLLV